LVLKPQSKKEPAFGHIRRSRASFVGSTVPPSCHPSVRIAMSSPTPRAPAQITLEIETVGAEVAAATARLNDLQMTERPIRITKRIVDDTIAQFEGTQERAPLDTRVATVRDLFERVDVNRRELKAVAVRNVTTDQGANRSDPVGDWPRRAGAGRVLNRLSSATNQIPLPHTLGGRASG
jgi:hypothetical protein